MNRDVRASIKWMGIMHDYRDRPRFARDALSHINWHTKKVLTRTFFFFFEAVKAYASTRGALDDDATWRRGAPPTCNARVIKHQPCSREGSESLIPLLEGRASST